jgi:hypothetical protein
LSLSKTPCEETLIVETETFTAREHWTGQTTGELRPGMAITISDRGGRCVPKDRLHMLTHFRRTGATTTKLSFKMPINAWSRSTVDAAVERLRHSVIPIIGADARSRPYLVGSALVLMYKERKVLVTAEHVLSDNVKVPLFFFGADGYSRPFSGEFAVSEVHDLAVKLLPPAEADALAHVPFIAEAVLGRVAAVGERFYASVAGYPATAAKRKDKVTLDTPMEVYSNFATELVDGRISVVFDKEEGAVDKSGHVNPRDAFGKSGGAIFGLPVDGAHIRPKETAKLVGVPTRWKQSQKRIEGSSIAVLSPLLDRVVANA